MCCRPLEVLCQQANRLFNEVLKATGGKREKKRWIGRKRGMKGIIRKQSEDKDKQRERQRGERGKHGVIDRDRASHREKARITAKLAKKGEEIVGGGY